MDPATGKPRWPTNQAPLSASRVHQVHAVLSGALGLAARYGWVPYNPALLAKGRARAEPEGEPVGAADEAALGRSPGGRMSASPESTRPRNRTEG